MIEVLDTFEHNIEKLVDARDLLGGERLNDMAPMAIIESVLSSLHRMSETPVREPDPLAEMRLAAADYAELAAIARRTEGQHERAQDDCMAGRDRCVAAQEAFDRSSKGATE